MLTLWVRCCKAQGCLAGGLHQDHEQIIAKLNAVNQAVNMDPASTPRPQVYLTPTRLVLSYLRARADITYTVETSTSLAPGSWTTTGVTQDTTTPVGSTAGATIPRNPAPTPRFLRLRIETASP